MKTEIDWRDKQGESISFEKWIELLNDNTYRVIGLTGGKIRVSTVWLGSSHGQNDKGASLIFETMVFGGPGDGECVRYATEKEAAHGHLLMASKYVEGFEELLYELKAELKRRKKSDAPKENAP